MKIIGIIVRLGLTSALLWRVWHHADWSVALAITGLTAGLEFSCIATSKILKALR